MSPQSVQITIDVTDGNSAEAVQQVVAQLNAIGPAGERAGAMAGAGMDQIGSHALTNLDNVRLLRDDLGVHIPRAMEKAIASNAMLSAAIGTMGSGLLAIGAADIFLHIGESIYNAYEKYISLNAAQDEFNKKLLEAQDKDFINPHSLEVAVDRLNQARDAAQDLRASAEAIHLIGWENILGGAGTGNVGQIGTGVGELLGANEMAGSAVNSQEQADALKRSYLGFQHQLAMAQIDEAHGLDSSLKGMQKINAEEGERLAKIKETARYEEQLNNILNTTPGQIRNWTPDIARGGASPSNPEADAQEETERRKSSAQRIEEQRSETQQIIEMQNQAINAGLEGNALRAAQEMQEIEAVTRKFQEGEISKRTALEETAAVRQKFAAEAAKLQEQLDEQTRHMADEAAQAGLKGMALLDAQLRTALDAINTAERKAVGTGGVETPQQTSDFAAQRYYAQQEFYQKGVDAQSQYEQKIQSLMDRSDDFELQGYARIEADNQKHLALLWQADKEYFNNFGQAMDAYRNQAIQVEADADRERQQLHARTMEQIVKEEQQTARTLLPEWQQAQLAVEDTYVDRLHQIQQDIKMHVMSEQEGAAAVTAAWQAANAQMQRDEEETRDKIASGLQSMFEHPEKYFENLGMKTAFQLMANEMLSAFQSSGPAAGILQYLFGMGPQMNTSANPMNAMESALQMGGHGTHSGAGGFNPSMTQFTQGSSTILSAAQMQLQAAATMQSAASALSMGGGGVPGLAGMGGGGFDLLGSTSGGSFGIPGTSGIPAGSGGLPPAFSSLSSSASGGMVGTSPFPETTGITIPGSFDSNGQFNSAATGSLGKAGSAIGGGLMAATSIYSAYTNSNPVSGLVGGAMGGMELGSAFGPEGAVIGAAVGALGGLFAGLFGDHGRGQAEGLDVNTIQPELTKDMQEYEAGATGYSAVASDLSSMLISAKNSTNQWGSGARNYYNSNIAPEINAALSSLQKQEAAGRSQVTLSAAQYHGGGWVGGFGDMATGDHEGFIHAMEREFVVNPVAAQAHAPILQAMNSGTNFAYSSSVQPRMPVASSAGSGANITIQAIDSKSVATWAKTGGGRALVAAINQAQGQYSGIGRG